MKFINAVISSLLSVGACMAMASLALAQVAMPETGVYFVSSVASGEALESNGPTAGQNVFLAPYNHGGRQKWIFTRQVDPKTHKPTDRYLIRLQNEDTTLIFQPHYVRERTALIQPGKSLIQLKPSADGNGMIFKSVPLNGEAMCAFHVADSNTEVRFAPDDGSAIFRWKIETAAD